MTLSLTSGLHHCWQRIFKNTNYFYAVRISISLAILSKIFIQTGYNCIHKKCQNISIVHLYSAADFQVKPKISRLAECKFAMPQPAKKFQLSRI